MDEQSYLISLTVFPVASWFFIAVSFIAAIVALLARFLPILRTARTSGIQDMEAELLPFEEFTVVPSVSVIVHVITDEEPLFDYLKAIMSQDYSDYEVILVTEYGREATTSLAERLHKVYPQRLYVTFIPPESHNLSRRKLVQTVGIKAAKGEIVLTTSSNCMIPSTKWLSLMMKPFCTGMPVDIVLGYSHILFDNLHGIGKWYREFDATLTACQWIGAALNHVPYRGDRQNLAFRRQLFFDRKGYSGTLHLHSGDDDIFINEIADKTNTAVMIPHDAILACDWGDSGNRVLSEQKERYRFTSRLLPQAPFLRAGVGSFMQWLCVVAAVLGAAMGFPHLFLVTVAFGIPVILFASEIAIYRKVAHSLGSVALFWSLPLFLLWHPVANWISRPSRRQRRKNFTFD